MSNKVFICLERFDSYKFSMASSEHRDHKSFFPHLSEDETFVMDRSKDTTLFTDPTPGTALQSGTNVYPPVPINNETFMAKPINVEQQTFVVKANIEKTFNVDVKNAQKCTTFHQRTCVLGRTFQSSNHVPPDPASKHLQSEKTFVLKSPVNVKAGQNKEFNLVNAYENPLIGTNFVGMSENDPSLDELSMLCLHGSMIENNYSTIKGKKTVNKTERNQINRKVAYGSQKQWFKISTRS